MERHSLERSVVMLVANFFFGQFSSKTAEFFEFFPNRFDIPHCPLRFLILTLIFYELIFGIRLLTALLHWQNRSGPWPKFQWPKVFRRPGFDVNIWEPKFFQRASVSLSHFSGLVSPVWHPNAGGRWNLKHWLHSIFCRIFSDFSTWFSNKILNYLEFSAFSVPWSDAYHLNWKKILSNV